VIAGDNKLPGSVPAPYHDIFISAANAQNSQAALVAAIFFAGEHGSSWPDPSGDQRGGGWATSNKGANGPFQFLLSTWEGYKIDGDKDGKADVQNLTDAAFGAANYLSANGGKPGASVADLRKAIFAYNHANWYVDNVMEAYNAFIAGENSTGQNNTGNLTQENVQGCGGNIGVSANGFVFPQKTSKASLKKNGWNPNCTNGIASMTGSKDHPVRSSASKCHHDYLAADILNDSGTTVVSPRPGRVIATKDKVVVGGLASGASVRIYSDPALGGDGLYYYLTHMLPKYKDSTAGVKVSVGQTVTAGQTLGVVGTAADAQGTIPHTHFDISSAENGFSRSSKGTEGPLLDPQPVLKASYEALPEN
jgi:murein DD-endopeptidase MepM/ murein hydrolase activator NlpD